MTRDQVIQWAQEAGVMQRIFGFLMSVQDLERFAALVAAAEREECAKMCDRFGAREMNPHECAAAIRGMK